MKDVAGPNSSGCWPSPTKLRCKRWLSFATLRPIRRTCQCLSSGLTCNWPGSVCVGIAEWLATTGCWPSATSAPTTSVRFVISVVTERIRTTYSKNVFEQAYRLFTGVEGARNCVLKRRLSTLKHTTLGKSRKPPLIREVFAQFSKPLYNFRKYFQKIIMSINIFLFDSHVIIITWQNAC